VDTHIFWKGFLLGINSLLIIAAPVAILLLILGLAKLNIFSTIVRENEVKIVIVNGKFAKFLIASHSFDFKKNTGKKWVKWVDQWEIVEVKKGSHRKTDKLPFIGGLRWVGIWPFAQIHTYRFTWTSLEQLPKGEVSETNLVAKTRDETIDYIFIKKDIYGLLLKTVETRELLPVDILIQIPARVINPYKSLFIAERWLEQVENLIADRLRLFVGSKSFSDLIHRKEKSSGEITDADLGGILTTIKQKFGIEIPFIGIRNIDPGSKEAEEFVKAAGAVFVAEQRAEATRIEGAGQTDRITKLYLAASQIKGGKEMLVAEAIRDSKITVISGGGLLPAVTVADTTKEG